MTPCVRCGADATQTLHPLSLKACDDCERAWLREESLSVEAVLAVVGAFPEARVPYREHFKRFAAELLKRTEAWVKESR